ncbi:MAG: alanine dehydrogenase [Deltaproteobacteria bacterium]|nr:alanine dehydrogenase [Deltaproteobacteria bacterium]
MIIGVPKEIKDSEYRVGMVPSGARALKDASHSVLVETNAGLGSSITDAEYKDAGAEIIQSGEEVYKRAELIVKVKEPRPQEYKYFRDDLVIFTFFHLAADKALADELLKSGVTAIAYETVELDDKTLPILSPMSEAAGRLSVQAGANFLMRPSGGRGVLLGGVPGVEAGCVAILGGGIVGRNAAKVAVGLGAEVIVLDVKLERLRQFDAEFNGRVKPLMSNSYNVVKALKRCDLLVGAAHSPGARTPKLVTREMVAMMKKGAVIVDVSVDQGGCVETIRPTTHSNPTYYISGVVHYGVANMPGAVPRTSTFALTNATLPFVMTMANLGLKKAAATDPAIKKGVNIHAGRVTHPSVAEALSRDFAQLNLK